jgi:hypothetical protein
VPWESDITRRIPLKRRKFAGGEGRFTPAQDSRPFILELFDSRLSGYESRAGVNRPSQPANLRLSSGIPDRFSNVSHSQLLPGGLKLESDDGVELQTGGRAIQRPRRRRDKRTEQSVGALGNNAAY